MSSLDLYDDLFPDDGSSQKENLGNSGEEISPIRSGRTNETEIENELWQANKSNEKLKKELNLLKRENANWQLVYKDVARKLDISKKNLSVLVKTTRNEISRKNETISGLKKELDNILFKRAVKSGTVKDLKEMIEKLHSAFRIELDSGRPNPVTLKSHNDKMIISNADINVNKELNDSRNLQGKYKYPYTLVMGTGPRNIAQIDLHQEFPQLVIFMHFRMIGMLEKRIEVQSGKGVLRHIKDRLIPNIMTQRPKARKNIKEVLFLRQSIIKRRHQKILTKDTRV